AAIPPGPRRPSTALKSTSNRAISTETRVWLASKNGDDDEKDPFWHFDRFRLGCAAGHRECGPCEAPGLSGAQRYEPVHRLAGLGQERLGPRSRPLIKLMFGRRERFLAPLP